MTGFSDYGDVPNEIVLLDEEPTTKQKAKHTQIVNQAMC